MADRPATNPRKRTGRKRRMAGWLLLVTGVLITGVWGASRWWWFGWFGRSSILQTGRGVLNLQWQTDGIADPEDRRWYYAANKPAGWDWLRQEPSIFEDNFSAPTRLLVCDVTFVRYQQWRTFAASRIRWELKNPLVHDVTILPWPFALASLLGGGWLLWSGRRARRRAMAGVCHKCGYDLAGLAATTSCPECGGASTAVSATPPCNT